MPKIHGNTKQNCAQVYQDAGVDCTTQEDADIQSQRYQELLREQEESRLLIIADTVKSQPKNTEAQAQKHYEDMVLEEFLLKKRSQVTSPKPAHDNREEQAQKSYEAIVLEEFLDRGYNTKYPSQKPNTMPIQPQVGNHHPSRATGINHLQDNYLTELARHHNTASVSVPLPLHQPVSPLQNANVLPTPMQSALESNANLAIMGGASVAVLGVAALLIKSWRRSRFFKTTPAKQEAAQAVPVIGYHIV